MILDTFLNFVKPHVMSPLRKGEKITHQDPKVILGRETYVDRELREGQTIGTFYHLVVSIRTRQEVYTCLYKMIPMYGCHSISDISNTSQGYLYREGSKFFFSVLNGEISHMFYA